jgi:hypothetical protein
MALAGTHNADVQQSLRDWTFPGRGPAPLHHRTMAGRISLVPLTQRRADRTVAAEESARHATIRNRRVSVFTSSGANRTTPWT